MYICESQSPMKIFILLLGKWEGRELFLYLLLLNCIRLKIILMPKWRILLPFSLFSVELNTSINHSRKLKFQVLCGSNSPVLLRSCLHRKSMDPFFFFLTWIAYMGNEHLERFLPVWGQPVFSWDTFM